MTDWLYPANVKFYDVLSAFKEEQAVWPIHSKIEVGDTVYIYLAAPHKRIAYVCSVKAIDIGHEMILKYSLPYIKKSSQAKPIDKRFMLLENIKLLSHNDNALLSLEALKANGLKGMLMGARKLDNNPQLQEHIRKYCIGKEI